MMEYMRDGGMNMWLMLVVALATAAFAATRPRAQRPAILVTGCVASLILGVLGLSLGLLMVGRNFQRFPDPVAALGMGLRELSNNGTFAALLATLQGLAALVTARQASREG